VTCLAPGQDEPIFNTAQKPATPDMNAHELLDRRIAHVDGDALGVAVTDRRIYLGGHFDVAEPDPDAKCLHTVPSKCMPPYSDTRTPNRHLVAYDHNGNIDPTFTPQADTAEGPTTMIVGPHALYLGGNFRTILDVHPSAHCWPCTQKRSVVSTFHPGLALFPAIR
jgi:hypothetical protein